RYLGQFGSSLFAISPQTVHQSFLMPDQHKLQFPLLSDSGNAVGRQFGLVYRVPEPQQQVYRRALVNLPFVNGDDSWELPIPATYIIGGRREGNQSPATQIQIQVLYASAQADYTERPEPAEILARISQLSS